MRPGSARRIASKMEKAFGAHLIIALEVNHVSIRGGRIDGNRKAFFNPESCSRGDFTGWRPSQMLYFCESSHIRLDGVEITNAPYSCFLHGRREVWMHGLKIANEPGVWNGDGIDIDCCREVTVSGCVIDSSDDSLAIRASGVSRLQRTPGICNRPAVEQIIKRGSSA